ncbi:MAG: helix-hairpin-helix domain-containing protein [Marmoricola sp.]
MHRQAQQEVAEAARRRLELLGRELDLAGLRRVDELEDEPVRGAGEAVPRPDLPEPSTVAPVGRHLRPPRPGPARRLRHHLGGHLGGWLGDRVPETLRGRVGLDPGPVLLVVALVAVAVTATAFVVMRMGGEAEPVPRSPALQTPSGSSSPLVQSAAPGPASAGASAAGSTAGSSSAASGSVTVDVAGKVRRPGVTTLPAGSRVVDALKQAGGPRGRVDLSTLNLARVLVDGEQILVGRQAPPGGLAASASTAAPDATGALVNLNTATSEQLDTLPGVGPVTAQKILDWRTANGAFSSVDELLEVDGIGEKTLADLAPHVTL